MLGIASSLVGLTVLVLGHVFLRANGIYAELPHLDIAMHVLGGGFLAMGCAATIPRDALRDTRASLLRWALVLGVVLLAAILWECLEVLLGVPSEGALARSEADAPKDIACGLAGAVLWMLGEPAADPEDSRASVQPPWIRSPKAPLRAEAWLHVARVRGD